MRICTLIGAAMIGGLYAQTAAGGLVVFARFANQPPAAVFTALTADIASAMMQAGIEVEWRSLDAHAGAVVSELAVVNFRGRCDGRGPYMQPEQQGPLGWTLVTDGHVSPFAEVDCDRIQSILARELSAALPERRAELFGRALAHVVAHELYHISTRAAHHSPSGIAKRFYTSADLLNRTIRFDEHAIDTLRGPLPTQR